MEEVELKYGKNKGMHRIYTVSEADELGMKYVPWREAETGDWALSDDGFVMEVFWHWVPKNGKRMIKVVRGTFLNSGYKMLNEVRESRSTYSGKHSKRVYITDAVKVWAARVAAGANPETAYSEVFGSTSKKYVLKKVKLLLKDERVMELIKTELKPIMEKLGITQEFVLQGYLDLYADADVSASVRFKCLDEMAILTGVKEREQRDDGGFIGVGDLFADAEITEGRKREALPQPDEDQPALEELEG